MRNRTGNNSGTGKYERKKGGERGEREEEEMERKGRREKGRKGRRGEGVMDEREKKSLGEWKKIMRDYWEERKGLRDMIGRGEGLKKI